MSVRSNAEKFINDQIKIMAKYGERPKLNAERYEEAVASTARAFAAMCPSESDSSKQEPRQDSKPQKHFR